MPILFAAVIEKNGAVLIYRSFSDTEQGHASQIIATFHAQLVRCTDAKGSIEYGSHRGIFRVMNDVILILCTDADDNIALSLKDMQLFGRICTRIYPQISAAVVEAEPLDLILALNELVFDGMILSGSAEEVLGRVAMSSKSEDLANIDEERKVHSAIKIGKNKARALTQKKAQNMLQSLRGNRHEFDLRPAMMDDIDLIRREDDELEKFYAQNDEKCASPDVTPLIDDIRDLHVFEDVNEQLKQQKDIKPASFETLQSPSKDGPIDIVIKESVSAELSVKGGLRSVRVDGTLSVKAADYRLQRQAIRLDGVDKTAYEYRISSEFDKASFMSHDILTLKTPGEIHIVNESIDILRWTSTEAKIKPPVAISLWPRSRSIMVEYEIDSSHPLEHVHIEIPLPGVSIQSVQAEVGECLVNTTAKYIRWNIDASTAGMQEAVLRAVFRNEFEPSKVLPIRAVFSSKKALSGVIAVDVKHMDTGASLPFHVEESVSSSDYMLR